MPRTTVEIDGKRVPFSKIVECHQKVENGGNHFCLPLKKENAKRSRWGEPRIYVFKDEETGKFNVKIGLEFVEANYCLMCGEKL